MCGDVEETRLCPQPGAETGRPSLGSGRRREAESKGTSGLTARGGGRLLGVGTTPERGGFHTGLWTCGGWGGRGKFAAQKLRDLPLAATQPCAEVPNPRRTEGGPWTDSLAFVSPLGLFILPLGLSFLSPRTGSLRTARSRLPCRFIKTARPSEPGPGRSEGRRVRVLVLVIGGCWPCPASLRTQLWGRGGGVGFPHGAHPCVDPSARARRKRAVWGFLRTRSAVPPGDKASAELRSPNPRGQAPPHLGAPVVTDWAESRGPGNRVCQACPSGGPRAERFPPSRVGPGQAPRLARSVLGQWATVSRTHCPSGSLGRPHRGTPWGAGDTGARGGPQALNPAPRGVGKVRGLRTWSP